MDPVNLLISSVGIVGGAFLIYQLRMKRRKVAFGFGGSIMILGLILLAIEDALISGILVWALTGVDLTAFAGFFYLVAKKDSPK
ncbi:MAG TPA: hypothetical protein VFV92_08375 [Candidatus Bathyarchaeia archaeon]|nr:hypothetical protein [Candidatus Bathyarchaeia archaeon]